MAKKRGDKDTSDQSAEPQQEVARKPKKGVKEPKSKPTLNKQPNEKMLTSLKDEVIKRLDFNDTFDVMENVGTTPHPKNGKESETTKPKNKTKKNAAVSDATLPSSHTNILSKQAKVKATSKVTKKAAKEVISEVKSTTGEAGTSKMKKPPSDSKVTSNQKKDAQANGNITQHLSFPKRKQPTIVMIRSALEELDDRKGTHVVSLRSFILGKHPELDATRFKLYYKRAVIKALEEGVLERAKGSEDMHGMTGRIKIVKKTSQKKKFPKATDENGTKEEPSSKMKAKKAPNIKTPDLNPKKKSNSKKTKKTVPKEAADN